MSDKNAEIMQKYHNDFLREVEANVEEGDWVHMASVQAPAR